MAKTRSPMPTKRDLRKAPDPNGCQHIVLPGSYCYGCHACLPIKPRRKTHAR